MKWLQAGLSKSGNMWLHNILQAVAKRAHIPQKSFIKDQSIYPVAKTWELSFPGQADIDTLVINPDQCLYRISSIFQMPIDNIDDYAARSTHVWTHSFCHPSSPKIMSKFDKIIYILRDPRDVAISLARFSLTPYRLKYFPHSEKSPESYLAKHLPETMNQWVQHVGGYLKEKKKLDIHFVFYERLLCSFDNESGRLLDHLGISLPDSEIQEIKNEVSFKSMKGKSPEHLRKGEWGQWTEVLSSKQIKITEKYAGKLMKILNYPITKEECLRFQKTTTLPGLPEKIDSVLIGRLMSESERKFKFERIRRYAFQFF